MLLIQWFKILIKMSMTEAITLKLNEKKFLVKFMYEDSATYIDT